MEVKVLSKTGEEKKTINLDDAVFGREVNKDAIYQAIKNELANARTGTASAKTRSEVIGSRKKPWRQKGTGRARAGTRQSPVWVGGGVAFGPSPRDFSYRIPKKIKRLAMKSILSQAAGDNRLKVVEDFTVEDGKTKSLAAVLKALVSEERTVLITGEDDPVLKRAGRNIPWLKFLSYNRLRAHDLFYGKNILLMEQAVDKLQEFYSVKK